MRILETTGLILALTIPAACGDASAPGAADSGEQAAGGAAGEIVDNALSGVPANLALDQFGIDTIKVVFSHFGSEEGTRTMWIENYGERVAIQRDYVTRFGSFEEPTRNIAYWDGERIYMHNLVNDQRSDMGLRQRDMEPASVTITSPTDLVNVGYERVGEMTIAGRTCEHWRNANLNYETCFWNRIELLSLNGYLEEGGFTLKHEAVEIVEGENIPEEIRALGG